jgi:formate-dependent nitrite reductase membrane component NrfD
LANPVLVAVEDAAGIPLALMLMGYTGVLLSCTSNPLWCKNPWLGPLFSASAVSAGASAVSLALRLGGTPEGAPSLRALDHVDSVSHAVETATAARFVACAGERAEPLTRGRRAPVFWGGGAMAVAAETLRFLPLRGRTGRWAKIAASVLSLGAGFCTRWSIVHAGRDAAEDPRLARAVTRRGGTAAAARGLRGAPGRAPQAERLKGVGVLGT